tara:strand:- start:429 stop:626 length:198 start_codon:yes stop_codon:yes gene_type:complete
MAKVNVDDTNTLEFYTLKGELVQLVDNQLLTVNGDILPYVSPNEAYDEYHYLLDNERDEYLKVKK